MALDVSPDGRRIAVGGSETTLYDAGTLGRIATSDLSTDKLAFRPDGRQLAVAVSDLSSARMVRLLDPVTLEETAVRLGGLPESGSAVVFDLGYSADGRFLAASLGCCELRGGDGVDLRLGPGCSGTADSSGRHHGFGVRVEPRRSPPLRQLVQLVAVSRSRHHLRHGDRSAASIRTTFLSTRDRWH